MLSVSPVLALVAVALLAGVVSGCATTQDRNVRAKVRAERLLASRHALLVTHRNAEVEVLDTTLLRADGRVAVVVRLRNRGAVPANDLPLTVGVHTHGGRVVALNRRARLPYFQTHAPAIAPGATVTWVFVATARRVPGGAPFARIGRTPAQPLTVAHTLPPLEASVAHTATTAGKPSRGVSARRSHRAATTTTVTARVANPTDVPQYDLDVYAWAQRGRRIVAAGRAQLAHLGTGEHQTVSIPLVGSGSGATVHVTAPPTLFQ